MEPKLFDQWERLAPDFAAIYRAHNRLAEVRKSLRWLEFELQQQDYELRQQFPRKPAEREKLLASLRKQIMELKDEENVLTAQIAMYDQLFTRMMLYLWTLTVPKTMYLQQQEEDNDVA